MKIAGTNEVVCRVKCLSLHAKSARFMKLYSHERCELIRIQPKGEWKITDSCLLNLSYNKQTFLN